jgi:hypothetical protein
LILVALSTAAAGKTITAKHVVVIFQENRTRQSVRKQSNFEPGVDIATFGQFKGKIPLAAAPLALLLRPESYAQSFCSSTTRKNGRR